MYMTIEDVLFTIKAPRPSRVDINIYKRRRVLLLLISGCGADAESICPYALCVIMLKGGPRKINAIPSRRCCWDGLVFAHIVQRQMFSFL